MHTPITDLHHIIASRRNIFFYEPPGSVVLPLPIRRLTATQLWVTPPREDVRFVGPLRGFVLAKQGEGIYYLEGAVDKPCVQENQVDVVPVDVDLRTMRFENRREHVRVAFLEPVGASLTKTKQPFPVVVRNFSVGGLCVQSSVPLKAGELVQVAFTPVLGETEYALHCDAVVIRRRDHQYPYWPNSYGLMHIPPTDPTPQQRQAFARTRQQMTRFVDDYLRMLRALES